MIEKTATAHETLRAYWTTEGFDFATVGVSEAELAALETRYGIRLPEEFRAYLMNICPADDSADEGLCTSWWPLARIRNIPEEYEWEVTDSAIAAEASTSLFFADYSIWASAWAICCGAGPNYGRIVSICGADKFVASGFRDFVERHVAGDVLF